MDNNIEQKIIIFVEFSAPDKTLIYHGLKLAQIFQKQLCLFYNIPRKQKKHYLQYKEQLNTYVNELRDINVSSLLLSSSFKQLPLLLTEEYEGILFVANALNKRYLSLIPDCTVPVLFIHPDSQVIDYNRLIQPVDIRKEIGDTTLWCSYFGRSNDASIVSLVANDKTRENRYNIQKNIENCKNIYDKFKIHHKLFKGKKNSLGNAFEALETALSSDCNLLVILGSSSITPLDLLIGLPEKKIIKKAGKLPIMVINPQRDNYILCD
jgi:hypothetical protein